MLTKKYDRQCEPLLSNNFFLFGARGTGKTSLVAERLGTGPSVLHIDLLQASELDRFSRQPDRLFDIIQEKHEQLEWVIIDEVQRLPRLLDIVHRTIENQVFQSPKFALTGSSARRLRLGAANLLAGRAFTNHLHPLTHLELGDDFDLDEILNWGSLPKIKHLQTDLERSEFLKSYALTYLNEEIWAEHLIQKLEPFRKFLEVAAQSNAKIVNYSGIARDVHADEKTIKSYYQILTDTLLGFFLEPYARGIRKKQRAKPKFYLFDLGVQKALARTTSLWTGPGTSVYGESFEHWIILEMLRLNDYIRRDYQFSYFSTADGREVDLIVERPGEAEVWLEIKSKMEIAPHDARHLVTLKKEMPEAEFWVLSQDLKEFESEGIHFLHWRTVFEKLFFGQR